MLRGVAGAALRKILVPIDFSRESEAALDYAARLAASLGASLTLFHASAAPPLMSAIVPGADSDADAERDARTAAQRLSTLGSQVRARGVEHVSVIVEPGTAIDAIVEHAARGRFDLIVMGTHGRTGIDRMVMGSVAERVVRLAPCPVMTIHLPRA